MSSSHLPTKESDKMQTKETKRLENIYQEEISEISFENEYLLITDYETKNAVEVRIDKNNNGKEVITIRSTFNGPIVKIKRFFSREGFYKST